MKKKYFLLVMVTSFLLLSITTSSWAINELELLLGTNGVLYKRTCTGLTCGSWTSIPGGFQKTPTLVWKEDLGLYVAIGLGTDGLLYRGTFTNAGVFNNDWTYVPGGTLQPVESASGVVSQEVLDVICRLVNSSSISPCPSFCNCSKVVFVSSITYDGNLGGLSGADAKCQQLATAAGLGGNFKAWLSDATQSPSTRFLHSTIRYVLVDGTAVALNWSDLTDGTLLHQINKTELSSLISTADCVWTNTIATGEANNGFHTPMYDSCGSWTSDSAAFTGWYGITSYTTHEWTQVGTFNGCHIQCHLYCMQQ